MKIAFGEIGRGKTRHVVQGGEWSLPEGVVIITPPSAQVTLQLTDEQTVTLEGTLSGALGLPCARCQDQVEYRLEEQFFYLVTTREEELSELPERECGTEECDTLYLQEPVIDVTWILQEQLFLDIPVKVLCHGECRGLCPQCGGSLNRDECRCEETESDSPFAVLKKLKK